MQMWHHTFGKIYIVRLATLGHQLNIICCNHLYVQLLTQRYVVSNGIPLENWNWYGLTFLRAAEKPNGAPVEAFRELLPDRWKKE